MEYHTGFKGRFIYRAVNRIERVVLWQNFYVVGRDESFLAILT